MASASSSSLSVAGGSSSSISAPKAKAATTTTSKKGSDNTALITVLVVTGVVVLIIVVLFLVKKYLYPCSTCSSPSSSPSSSGSLSSPSSPSSSSPSSAPSAPPSQTVARAAAGASPAILSNTQDIKSEDEFQRLFSNFVAAKQINAARTNAAQLQKQAEGQALRINPPSRRYVVMTVHAPWCGHCKRLVPVWRSVLDPSKLDAAGVTALDWDSDAVPKEVNQAVLRRYNVRGYPTVLKLDAATGDVVDEYKGGPDAQALQAFLYGGK